MGHIARIAVHADRRTGLYRPIWNWFGYDEPNYTYTANGRKLLAQLAALSPAPVRIRAHNLLTSGDGTASLKWGSTNAYSEDAAGNPVYDWTIMDRIFDAYVEAGVVPFVQVGFTPEALATAKGPYRHAFSLEQPTSSITTGWASPPRELNKWSGLVAAWAQHLADRYGRARVVEWPWEVWNEPDGLYWTGSIAEFCALYDATAKAIKRVLPGARVGGPHTCGASESEKARTFLRAFLRHCTENESPLDFVAFHAKGKPVVHDGHVRMGLDRQLRDIATNLSIMAEFPKYRSLPAILGESDPEGCAACSARVYPQNAYRNGPLYGVYVVEHILRTYELSRRADIAIEGAVTWAFLFEGQPWFDGFRDLATNGIGKAVLNAFRMLGMLGGDWLSTTSSMAVPLDSILKDGVRTKPDINAVATRDDGGISVLLWNYHDDDVPAEATPVELTIAGASAAYALSHYRMDETHGNSFAAWKAMGRPAEPDGSQYRELEAASELPRIEQSSISAADGALRLGFSLPRQAVSLLRLET
jgi:xylan 1,4-beta-xylosidase